MHGNQMRIVFDSGKRALNVVVAGVSVKSWVGNGEVPLPYAEA